MDKTTLISSIWAGEYDDCLDEIVNAVRQRKTERSFSQPIAVGSRVRLSGLKPKYLNGAEVEVVKINPRKIVVAFPHDSRYRRYAGSQRVSIPRTACELIP